MGLLGRNTVIGAGLASLLAIAGPAGIAIGHSAHPVPENTHPTAGALFGTVSAPDSDEPLAGVCVEASLRGAPYWLRSYRTRTTDQGHYFFPEMRLGSYELGFDPNCAASQVRGRFAAQWYPGALTPADATPVRLYAMETAIVDVTLVPAAEVTVRVVDATGADVTTCARAYPTSVPRIDVSTPDRPGLRLPAPVDAARVYSGEGRLFVPATTLRFLVGCLRGQPDERPAPFGYIPQWTEAVSVPSAGTTITVTLARAGTISGVLRMDASDASPRRLAVHRTADQVVSRMWVDDTFESGRLAPGEYRVVANPPPWQRWTGWTLDEPREWYDDANTFGGAHPIAVSAGNSTVIDWEVRPVFPDLAVTDLAVTNPAIETAYAGAPGPGVTKKIRVAAGIANGYEGRGRAKVCVWAVPNGDPATGYGYGADLISRYYIDLDEDGWSRTMRWTPSEMVGDIEIMATILPSGGWGWESPTANDTRRVETFVGVGGAGTVMLDRDWLPFGSGLLGSGNDYC